MDKQYKRLREELEGCRQVMGLDQAVMAAILEKTGEVQVSRERVRRCLQERQTVRAEQTAEGFRLWTEGGGKA